MHKIFHILKRDVGKKNSFKTHKTNKQRTESHHTFFPEVDSNCCDELGVELVVCVSVQEGCLPNSRVPQGQEFDQIVIVPISHNADLDEPAYQGKRKPGMREKSIIQTQSSSKFLLHC